MHKLAISAFCAVSLCRKHYLRSRLDKDDVDNRRSKSTGHGRIICFTVVSRYITNLFYYVLNACF